MLGVQRHSGDPQPSAEGNAEVKDGFNLVSDASLPDTLVLLSNIRQTLPAVPPGDTRELLPGPRAAAVGPACLRSW